MKLAQVFDPRNNALNAWRLVLATGVILWHSWLLTGRELTYQPAAQLLKHAWVDGFFALSGFLITASWLNNPRLRTYFVARGLRILPGLWACLAVTALVIAPLGVAIQGGSFAKLLMSSAPIEYVVKNSAVVWAQPGIGGTPNGVPWPHGWDGSLWTLIWEVLCYIAVAVVGVTGLRNRRWLIPGALAVALLFSALLPPWSIFVEIPAETGQGIDLVTAAQVVGMVVARFAVMFLAGAFLYQFRNAIPANWLLVAAAAIITLASALMPNYRLIGAIPLAYLVIVSGALIKNRRLNLRTDLSYGMYIYAFPVQQLLVIVAIATVGLEHVNPIELAIVATIATLPLAAMSWFLVEKPALSLKRRFKARAQLNPPPSLTAAGRGT